MSSLHPIDEIAIRQGSSISTLTAKQLLAAQIAAQTAEWLAEGNQIKTAQGHTGKAIPFCPSNADAVAAKNTAWKNFEISRAQGAKASPLFKRGANHRANIMDFMRKAGRAVTVAEIAEYMGATPEAIHWHIGTLCDRDQIKPAGKRRHARLYEVVK